MPGSMVENHRSEGRLTTAADPHEVDLQHRQHSMMEDQLSKGHLTTAANPPEVDLTLPTQASFCLLYTSDAADE